MSWIRGTPGLSDSFFKMNQNLLCHYFAFPQHVSGIQKSSASFEPSGPLQNLESVPCGPTFSVAMGGLGAKWALLLGLALPLGESKKHESLKIRNQWKNLMD